MPMIELHLDSFVSRFRHRCYDVIGFAQKIPLSLSMRIDAYRKALSIGLLIMPNDVDHLMRMKIGSRSMLMLMVLHSECRSHSRREQISIKLE